MTLDLTQGICKNKQYDAWKFPGGEIHLKLNVEIGDYLHIKIRLNTSDDFIFLLLVVDTIKKENKRCKIDLNIPYMAYQQADRNFSKGECFSLKTICNLINSMNLDNVYVFAPHSDVTCALINNCVRVDNHNFIKNVLMDLSENNYISKYLTNEIDDLVLISPDAGAYKLIYKLSEDLGLKKCEIITCSKSRNHETGVITTVVPKFDENKTVLIIDDICLAGNTFFNIRKEIPNENVFLAVSHGIFNDNVDKLEAQFTKVYTTNSRRDKSIGENIVMFKIF